VRRCTWRGLESASIDDDCASNVVVNRTTARITRCPQQTNGGQVGEPSDVSKQCDIAPEGLSVRIPDDPQLEQAFPQRLACLASFLEREVEQTERHQCQARNQQED
jgi:hypothetical protein